ncbi:MAG: hypothetical protein QW035_00285 [Candidatus Anstonellales archaeon]
MKMLGYLFMLMLFASLAFSVSDERKECLRKCCEMSGGTFIYEQDGCNNPGEGEMECAMQCEEPEDNSCPLALATLELPIGLLLARKC